MGKLTPTYLKSLIMHYNCCLLRSNHFYLFINSNVLFYGIQMSSSYKVAELFTFDKRLIEVGSGKYQPNDFCNCKVVINCDEVEGVAKMVGYALDRETTVVIGSGQTYVACVIDMCLQTMKEGDKCLLIIHCDELTATTSQCQLELNITLLSFEQYVEVHKLSVPEKIARASILKELGAAAFKSGDTVVAFYKFSRSLKYLTCAVCSEISSETNITECTEETAVCQSVQSSNPQQQVDEMVCQCLLNIAACQLRRENYDMALANCTSALAIDPGNVKGLFRRARCYVQLRNEELAVIDLEQAVSLEPGNREIVKLLATAKEAVRKSDEQLAKAMGKMFNSS